MATTWQDVQDAEKAKAMEAAGPADVSFLDRAKASFEQDPEYRAQILRDAGHDSVRVHTDGRLIVTDKQGIDRFMDPSEFETGDIADMVGELPGIGGEVFGGIAGAPAGVGGAMAGAMAGGAMGDAVRQGIAGLAGSERPFDMGQSATAGTFAGVGEGVGQALGRGVLAPLYKGYKSARAGQYRDAAGEGIQQAQNDAMTQLGIDPENVPASAMTTHPDVQSISNAADRIPSLQPIVEQQRKQMVGEVAKVIDDARISLWEGADQAMQMQYGPEQAQNFIEKDLADAMTGWASSAGKLKNKAEEAMLDALPDGAETRIDMSPLLKHLDTTIERLTKTLKGTEKSRVKALKTLRDDVASWETIGDYRASKSVIGENLFETDKFGRLANGIYGSMLESFEQTAQNAGAKEAVVHYQTMANIHKHQKALENDPMFRQWWKKRNNATVMPEVDVVKLSNAFQKVMYSNAPEVVRNFRKMIGAEQMATAPATREGKHVWQSFQRIAFDMLMDKASTQGAQATGVGVSGGTLDREIKRMGRGVMNEVFGPEATQTLSTLAKFLQNEQIKRMPTMNPSQTAYAQNAIQSLRASWANPMDKLGQVAGDRKLRNKVAQTILPSGSKKVPAGKEYYARGVVPTVNQIADGFAQMGIGPAQFQNIWRLSAQAAQREAQEQMFQRSGGGASDATQTAQPGIGAAGFDPMSGPSQNPQTPVPGQIEQGQVFPEMGAGASQGSIGPPGRTNTPGGYQEPVGVREDVARISDIPEVDPLAPGGLDSWSDHSLMSIAKGAVNVPGSLLNNVVGLMKVAEDPKEVVDVGVELFGGGPSWLSSKMRGEELSPQGKFFQLAMGAIKDDIIDPNKPINDPVGWLLDVGDIVLRGAGAITGGATMLGSLPISARRASRLRAILTKVRKEAKMKKPSGESLAELQRELGETYQMMVDTPVGAAALQARVDERVNRYAQLGVEQQGGDLYMTPGRGTKAEGRGPEAFGDPLPGDVPIPHGEIEDWMSYAVDKYGDAPTPDEFVKAGHEYYGAIGKKFDETQLGVVKNVSVAKLIGETSAALAKNPAFSKWYNQFNHKMREVVGDNIDEFAGLFAITSAQNPVESNLADTLMLMRWYRQYMSEAGGNYKADKFVDFINDRVKGGAKEDPKHTFMKGIDKKGKPETESYSNAALPMSQRQNIANFYKNGIYEQKNSSLLKTRTYGMSVVDKDKYGYFYYPVNDVWMGHVFGKSSPDSWTTQEYRIASYLQAKVAQQLNLSLDEVQALLWWNEKAVVTMEPKDSILGMLGYDKQAHATRMGARKKEIDAWKKTPEGKAALKGLDKNASKEALQTAFPLPKKDKTWDKEIGSTESALQHSTFMLDQLHDVLDVATPGPYDFKNRFVEMDHLHKKGQPGVTYESGMDTPMAYATSASQYPSGPLASETYAGLAKARNPEDPRFSKDLKPTIVPEEYFSGHSREARRTPAQVLFNR